MKRLLITFAFLMASLLGSLNLYAQINWMNFENVKVKTQKGYSGTLPPDSNFDDNKFHEDEVWLITLGRELQEGVYVILDENGYNTGNTIHLGSSGLSGLWGWLNLQYTNAESPFEEHHRQGKGFFHTRSYSLMLNPLTYPDR